MEIRREKATHTAFGEIILVQECSFILRVTPIICIREIVTDKPGSETWFVLCDTSFLPAPEIKLGQLITDQKVRRNDLGMVLWNQVHWMLSSPATLMQEEQYKWSRILTSMLACLRKSSIYDAVGIKVGNNANVVRQSRRRKVGGNVSGLVPGAAVDIPLDLQAKVWATTNKDRFDAYRVPNDLLFAYRLQEIRYFK